MKRSKPLKPGRLKKPGLIIKTGSRPEVTTGRCQTVDFRSETSDNNLKKALLNLTKYRTDVQRLGFSTRLKQSLSRSGWVKLFGRGSAESTGSMQKAVGKVPLLPNAWYFCGKRQSLILEREDGILKEEVDTRLQILERR